MPAEDADRPTNINLPVSRGATWEPTISLNECYLCNYASTRQSNERQPEKETDGKMAAMQQVFCLSLGFVMVSLSVLGLPTKAILMSKDRENYKSGSWYSVGKKPMRSDEASWRCYRPEYATDRPALGPTSPYTSGVQGHPHF